MRNIFGLPENVSWSGLVLNHCCISVLSIVHIGSVQGQLWESPHQPGLGLYPREKDDSYSLEILAWLWFVELLEMWIIANYFQKWTLPLLPSFHFGTLWCVMAPLVPRFFFCSCLLSESIWQQDTNHLKQSVSALSLFWSIKSCKYQINTMFLFSCILESGPVSQSNHLYPVIYSMILSFSMNLFLLEVF